MGNVVLGRVLVLGGMTAAVAAGVVSLPVLAGVTALAGVLGTFEVLGVRHHRNVDGHFVGGRVTTSR
jgi:hypothetical protein